MRDMSKIAKTVHLRTSLAKAFEERQVEIDKWADSAKKDIDYALRCADKMFKINAERKVLTFVEHYITWLEKEGNTELTLQDIRTHLWEEFRFNRAVPRSTCPLSNLSEQYVLDEAISCSHGHNYMLSRLFMDAQFYDEEYQAWSKDRRDEAQAKRDAERIILDEQKRKDKAEARAARRANKEK